MKSLSIRKQLLSENDPELATTYCNLGSFYADIEEYAKAERYLLDGLRIDKIILDAKSP